MLDPSNLEGTKVDCLGEKPSSPDSGLASEVPLLCPIRPEKEVLFFMQELWETNTEFPCWSRCSFLAPSRLDNRHGSGHSLLVPLTRVSTTPNQGVLAVDRGTQSSIRPQLHVPTVHRASISMDIAQASGCRWAIRVTCSSTGRACRLRPPFRKSVAAPLAVGF